MLSDVYGEKAARTWCANVREINGRTVVHAIMSVEQASDLLDDLERFGFENAGRRDSYSATWGSFDSNRGLVEGFVVVVEGDYCTARDAALAEYRDHMAFLTDLDSRAE
jgi:hypothetical protein